MEPKTFIFDFDGTLADSFELLLEIFQEITRRPKALTKKEIEDLKGKNLIQIIEYLEIRRWQIPILILRAKKLIAFRITGVVMFPGVSEGLEDLHKRGYQLYILSTNSSENIRTFLKKEGVEDCFTKVYGDIGLRSKSSALKKIIKREKLNAADCVYIGDEVRDIEAGRKSGIKTAAVSWGFNNSKTLKNAGADFIIDKPANLAKYLTSQVFSDCLPSR